MERKTLSQLWREDGKKVPFAQFASEFNNRNFRNFVSAETAEKVFGIKNNTVPETQEAIDKKMNLNGINPQKTDFDKKQGVLLLLLGVSAGVVAGLLIMKQK